MIDIEIRMSQPLLRIPEAERLRQHLLLHIVDINNVAVQTRETLLRVLNSNLGPVFFNLNPKWQSLIVLICEKRNSLDIDNDLKVYDVFYSQVLSALRKYNVLPQHVELIAAGLKSNSAIMRVAARCAVVLLVAYVEVGLDNA
jgi:hypothetical protein